MMGLREDGQVQFLYAFNLDKVVPADHLVRQIDAILDLSWVHRELRPYYSHTGRPSIDPVLMIRMLLVGYVFALRSERRLCSEVQVNLGRAPMEPSVAPILSSTRSAMFMSAQVAPLLPAPTTSTRVVPSTTGPARKTARPVP